MDLLQDKGFIEFIWASVSKAIDQNHFEDLGRPAKALNSYPLIDFMRSFVRDDQVPTLLEHCDSEDDEISEPVKKSIFSALAVMNARRKSFQEPWNGNSPV